MSQGRSCNGLCQKANVPLNDCFVFCEFHIHSDYHFSDTHISTGVLFLDTTRFFHTFTPLNPRKVHSYAQIYQLNHARICAHFNLKYGIVFVAAKGSGRHLLEVNSGRANFLFNMVYRTFLYNPTNLKVHKKHRAL